MESHHLKTEAWKGLDISFNRALLSKSTTVVILVPLLLSLSSYAVLYMVHDCDPKKPLTSINFTINDNTTVTLSKQYFTNIALYL